MPSTEPSQALSVGDVILKILLPALVLVALQILREWLKSYRSRTTLLNDIKILKALEDSHMISPVLETYVRDRVNRMYGPDRKQITNLEHLILGVVLVVVGMFMVVHGLIEPATTWEWGAGIGVILLGLGGISNGYDPKYAKTK